MVKTYKKIAFNVINIGIKDIDKKITICFNNYQENPKDKTRRL